MKGTPPKRVKSRKNKRKCSSLAKKLGFQFLGAEDVDHPPLDGSSLGGKKIIERNGVPLEIERVGDLAD